MTPPEIPEQVQRWAAKRRVALVLSLLQGETSVQEAARQPGLTVAEVEDWRDKFLLGAENALIWRGTPRAPLATRRRSGWLHPPWMAGKRPPSDPMERPAP
jgi:hypothetical protein